MMPSLQSIARDLGGRVKGDHVVAPGPGQKPRDRSLSVWSDGDSIRVHSHRSDVDWKAGQAYVRERCGMPAWRPKAKRPPKPPAPFRERNQFVGECLRIIRHRKRATLEQFALLVNDLKHAGTDAEAWRYAQEFGFSYAELEAAEAPAWRPYTARERAKIFDMHLPERLQLDLRPHRLR
jgi:hypothetical protein